jgi:hypothetical protein
MQLMGQIQLHRPTDDRWAWRDDRVTGGALVTEGFNSTLLLVRGNLASLALPCDRWQDLRVWKHGNESPMMSFWSLCVSCLFIQTEQTEQTVFFFSHLKKHPP